MVGPLEGIRAVEWGQGANGPVIGVVLGDLGADVVKIEERGVGDSFRGARRSEGAPQLLSTGINAVRENTNRNKRSISLDLKKERGREIIYKLIENADVFYTNYGQTSAAKRGVDYETLSRINPRLIYCNATGYGSRGPDSEKRAFDPSAQARSGLMASSGEPGSSPSRIVGDPIDCLGATIGALGITAALVTRQRTGEGQMINTSLLGTAIWMQLFNIQTGLLRRGSREHIGMARFNRRKPNSPLNNQYQCSDGKWLVLVESQFDRFWGEFCHVVGIEEPEYVNLDMKAVQEGNSRERLVSFLDKLFASKPRTEWLKIFEEKDARFVYAPVNEVSDLLHDAQVLSNNYFVDFEHPVAGPVKLVNHPIEYSKTPARVKRAAPDFGQHTEEILLEIGYTHDDIKKFREEEVI